MNRLFLIFKTLVGITVAGIAFAGIYTHSGWYDVAADSAHYPLTHWVLDRTRQHSIAARAGAIEPRIPELSAETLHRAVIGYEEMCAGCHAPPGRGRSALARGLNPSPPNLAQSANKLTPSTLFWIIKHGIRMSGMPAWGAMHSDDDIWALVALLLDFPGMQGEVYERMLVTARETGIGHAHDHGEDQDKHDH